jgi:hypothetical protein
MKPKKILGKFSEALIKKYLDDKAYERRGWTREKYIEKCKEVWKQTKYDPVYEKKVIIDFSEPVTVSQLFGIDEFEVDFVDGALTQLTVHGFEDKKDIECTVFVSGKRSEGNGKIELVKIAEAFRPTNPPIEKESLGEEHYLVALFDVLGFSNLVVEKGSEAILHTYQELINIAIFDNSYTAFGRMRVGHSNYVMGGSYTPINYTFFSDTIMLWTTPCDTHVSPFLAKCADLICEALRIGMPLRGSICFGEAVMHKTTNTFIGKAIVEANDIEKNQRWIGATLGKAFVLQELKCAVSEMLVVPLYCEHYKEEMKPFDSYLTLDWMARWKEKNYPDIVPVLENMKDKAPEKNKIYYDNTINFVSHASQFDLQTRGVFLKANSSRIEGVGRVNVNDLHGRLLILKAATEIPHSGFILAFSDEILQSNEELRNLLSNNFLFVKFLDRNRMIEFLSKMGKKKLDLADAGFFYTVEKKHVEYLDIFHYDK